MLKSADSTLMSILPCPGLGQNQDQPLQLNLLYTVPQQLVDPRSLRSLLTDPTARDRRGGVIHPLDDRIRLANKLATAVLYVHSQGAFVHKHIRPENVIIFWDSDIDEFPKGVGYPFLVGFGQSRADLGRTEEKGHLKLDECIYQHPDRWGLKAEERYSMLHDV